VKSKKTDGRSVYTQMLVKKALLRLLSKKPINKITVSELCADAGTNRITFYNHFHDIYDVYETIENDFYNDIVDRLKNLKSYDAEVNVIKEIILQLYRNAEICSLFISVKSNLVDRIMKAVREKYMTEMTPQYRHVPAEILNAFFTFQMNGYMGLVFDWIQSGMKQSPEDISKLIGEFNRLSQGAILKRYETLI
jgi:AcrR family transcriptional regulator